MAFSFDGLIGGFDTLWDSALAKFDDLLELGITPGTGELAGGVSSQLGEQLENRQTAPAPAPAGIPTIVWILLALALGVAVLPRVFK